MPIYRYKAIDSGCPHCQEGFDLLQKLSEAELSVCPQCRAAIRKQICAPALAMGGSHLLSEKKIGEKGCTKRPPAKARTSSARTDSPKPLAQAQSSGAYHPGVLIIDLACDQLRPK